MKIKGKKILPHIYLLNFETQYNLCMSFVRIQEFYESPKFKGKYFTLEEFMDYWASKQGDGSFNYPKTWNGFNIPGTILEKWMDKFQAHEDCFREKEISLLSVVDKLHLSENEDNDVWTKIYVIGTWGNNDKKVIDHEIAHALYTLDKGYKRSCNKLLASINKTELKRARNHLLTMGYSKPFFNDEMQAYFSTSNLPFSVLGMRQEFKDNFEKYKNMWGKNNN